MSTYAIDWQGYTPEKWVTGDEPMTTLQLDWIRKRYCYTYRNLVQRTARGQRFSKAEAAMVIDKLKARKPIMRAFLDSLGQNGPYEGPGHPATWYHRHAPMSPMQRTMRDHLIQQLGFSPAEIGQALTFGQTAVLIDILRTEKAEALFAERGPQWLQDAVTRAIQEVPLPVPATA